MAKKKSQTEEEINKEIEELLKKPEKVEVIEVEDPLKEDEPTPIYHDKERPRYVPAGGHHAKKGNGAFYLSIMGILVLIYILIWIFGAK